MQPLPARSRTRTLPIPLTLTVLTLAACIENEEEIEVREDGSVRVTVTAAGDAPDLADGYPLPFGAAWTPATDETRDWLRRVGSGPVSDETRRQARQIHAERGDDGVELVVSAEFAGADAWPHWTAPAQDPYATAYMERDARLEVREQGGRRVYTFERVYRGRDYHRLDFYTRLESEAEELVSRFGEEDEPFSDDEWVRLAEVVKRVFADVADLYVRDAVLGVYTEGDASLSLEALPELFANVRSTASELITVERLKTIQRASRQDGKASAALLEELQEEFRDGMRRELTLALDAWSVGERVRNALLYALEWGFTAQDAYGDMLDETYKVTLELPGTLVGGNFDDTEGNVAIWEFGGEAMVFGDVVLRATSVLE